MKKFVMLLTIFALSACAAETETQNRADCTKEQVISDGIVRGISVLTGGVTWGGC